MKPFSDLRVSRVFSTYRPTGALEETLKWREPSYPTAETKSGSAIRLDAIRSRPGDDALHFHCQTTLLETFSEKFGAPFSYGVNRALISSVPDNLHEAEVREYIALALTYHSRKKGDLIPIGLQIQ